MAWSRKIIIDARDIISSGISLRLLMVGSNLERKPLMTNARQADADRAEMRYAMTPISYHASVEEMATLARHIAAR